MLLHKIFEDVVVRFHGLVEPANVVICHVLLFRARDGIVVQRCSYSILKFPRDRQHGCYGLVGSCLLNCLQGVHLT